jgi:hypothetical protein
VLNELKSFLGRIRVRTAPLVAALVAALPVLLDQLGIIDFKPILTHFMAPEYAVALVGLMPFLLAFLKPLVHLAEEEVTKE